MNTILNLNSKDTELIADIIVSFSILDDMLCEYILEYNKLSNDEFFSKEAEKIKTDRASLGIKDKINCLTQIFPNNQDRNGYKINELKSKLCNIKKYRVQIAHNRRFSLRNGIFSEDKKYNKEQLPLCKIHQLYKQNFDALSPIFEVFYSDWEYREYFLYNLKDRSFYV